MDHGSHLDNHGVIVKKLIDIYKNVTEGFDLICREYIKIIAKNCISIHADGKVFWNVYSLLIEQDSEKQWYIDNSGLARWY